MLVFLKGLALLVQSVTRLEADGPRYVHFEPW